MLICLFDTGLLDSGHEILKRHSRLAVTRHEVIVIIES